MTHGKERLERDDIVLSVRQTQVRRCTIRNTVFEQYIEASIEVISCYR